MSYLSHLESSVDGSRFPPRTIQSTHLGRPLLARYDLESIRESVSREYLNDRPLSMWRYGDLLPLEHSHHCVTLGEHVSPLTKEHDLGKWAGIDDLWVKNETVLPTGSFKSRGMAVAISMARELGIRRVAMPTAGNAGAALAAYADLADIEAFVFMPIDAPVLNQVQTAAGAHLILVDGLISDCGRFVEEGKEVAGWFDFSTLREPYRLEGKKTMGFELAEQCAWHLPDVILYPTGGGTGLIGMWKAFAELRELGWLETADSPRMVAVQSSGCSPLVSGWKEGRTHCRPFENPSTIASGLRVPSTIGDTMILTAIRESGGTAVEVAEARIREWMEIGRDTTGVSVGPESATCIGAARKLVEQDWIAAGERVVIFNCGPDREQAGLERPVTPVLNPESEPEWEKILDA